ncbi:MAG TPA: methyltransferase domain-containing protein [Candidatus Saccharimonadales bacterium]|nr:methyltransferase domain-containing protein [Candidatus Saccharimonadales bacterium]
MDAIVLIVGILILVFGLVVFVGPPFLPTMRNNITTALDLLDLKPGQTLLELGSGDGRVARAAAARGLKVVGIEINPILVVVARLRCWRYRSQVTIIWDDIWKSKWPQNVDGIFTFLLQRQMGRLHKKIEAWHTKPVKLASFGFYIPDKPPVSKYNGIFLYEYGKATPAKKRQ